MTENGTGSVQTDPVPVPTRHRPRGHLSLKLVYHYFISNFFYLVLVPLLAIASVRLSNLTADDLLVLQNHMHNNVVSVIISSTLVVLLLTVYHMRRPSPVYLLNFSCYKPADARKVTREIFMDRSEQAGTFTKVQLLLYHICL
jgi:3-ketoacyl-CoA synthase